MAEKKRRGPPPEHLNLDGDWEEAMGEALKKKRPEEGWPEKGSKDSDDAEEEPEEED